MIAQKSEALRPFRRSYFYPLSTNNYSLFQRPQIRDYGFGVGAVHLVLRHGRPRRLSIRSQTDHEELDSLFLIPADEAGDVGRGVGDHTGMGTMGPNSSFLPCSHWVMMYWP